MADFRTGQVSFVTRMRADEAADEPNDLTRKGEVDAALAGKAAGDHSHGVADVTDFEDGWNAAFATQMQNSETIEWDQDSQIWFGQVRIKAASGLAYDNDGVYVQFGTGATDVAAGNHSHAQLHDALTFVKGNGIDGDLVTQELTVSVKAKPSSGITVDPSGVGVDFGSGANQASPGNHTHAQLHDAATAADTNSVQMVIGGTGGQVVQANVKLGSLLVPGQGQVAIKTGSGAGLYIPLGVTEFVAAAGDHSHGNATTSEAGFMSAADKQKLEDFTYIANIEQSALFVRHDYLQAGKYVGGRHRWGQAMQIKAAHLTASAPTAQCELAIQSGGVTLATIAIPAGTPGAEVTNYVEFTSLNIHVNKDSMLRVVGLSGVGSIVDEPTMVNVSVIVAPSQGGGFAVTNAFNSGGGVVSPFINDQLFTGGTTSSTANAVNLAGVTDPAPEAVYQTIRRQLNDSDSITYAFSGLAIGLDYKVRLHFNEFVHANIGDQVFNINVTGKGGTIVGTLGTPYDILAATSGVQNKAVVQEYTHQANAAGELTVEFDPVANGIGEFNCSVCGIELVPQF